jgi:hypothetical protein
MQTCPTAWLKTRVLPAGDREVYPDAQDNANTPTIRMASQFLAPVQGQVMGLLRVGASFSVRGRQLDNTLTAQMIAKRIQEKHIPIADVNRQY